MEIRPKYHFFHFPFSGWPSYIFGFAFVFIMKEALNQTECVIGREIVPCNSWEFLTMTYFFIAFGIFWILFPFLVAVYEYFAYPQKVYILHPNYIEYTSGFLNKKQRFFPKKYKRNAFRKAEDEDEGDDDNNFEDIWIKRTFAQKFFNIGTIVINSCSGKSLIMEDIPEPDRVVELIKALYHIEEED